MDDGLKTWFNPSKEPNPLVFHVFWSKLKHIIEVNIYLILFLNTTHNNSKKRLKTIYSFLIFTPIIIICLIDYIYFIIVELLSIFHMTLPNNSSDMK